MLQSIFIVLWLPLFSEAKINYCDASLENEVCFQKKPYISSISPDPLPTSVNITLNVIEAIGIDEEEQTMKVMFNLFLDWYDPRLSVKQSKEYADRYRLTVHP